VECSVAAEHQALWRRIAVAPDAKRRALRRSATGARQHGSSDWPQWRGRRLCFAVPTGRRADERLRLQPRRSGHASARRSVAHEPGGALPVAL